MFLVVSSRSYNEDDKEPRVHVEHFFDINYLENVGYVNKAHLFLCCIHQFFEDPKVVVPEIIREF